MRISTCTSFYKPERVKKLKKYARNNGFKEGLDRVLELMSMVERVEDLSHYSFLHFEALRNGNYSGHYSVRIQNRSPERLIFKQSENEHKVLIIVITELNTTHYGRKK